MTEQDSTPDQLRRYAPLLLAVAVAAWCVRQRWLSVGIPDAGDGMGHYLHARYAWLHAEAALSQWGKPLFSLLAAPFAWFGPMGVSVFCGLCVVLTCAVVFAALPRYAGWWPWVLPLLIVSIPVVPATVAAGLTEPFFGLWSVLVVAALLKRRYKAALVLASFLPFVRPEYVVLAPLVLLWVLRAGQWRLLPWGLLGVGLYSLASGVLLGEPWAFFVDHSYMGNTIYGRGDARYFLDRYGEITGPWFARVFLIAMVSVPLLLMLRRTDRPALLEGLALTALPAIGIFVLHSYAWWRGDLASLGLTRVMATAAPLAAWAVLLVLVEWGRALPARPWLGRVAVLIFLLWYVPEFKPRLATAAALPAQWDAKQALVAEAAALVQAERTPGRPVYFADPLIGVLAGLDPWDPAQACLWEAYAPERNIPDLHAGDLLVWEAHFAGYERGISADDLYADPRVRYVSTLEPDPPFTVLGDALYRIDVLRVEPTVRELVVDTLMHETIVREGLVHERRFVITEWPGYVEFAENDFPLTLSGFPPARPGTYREELLLVGELLDDGREGLVVGLSAAEDDPVPPRHWDLPSGPFHVSMDLPLSGDRTDMKLYFWDQRPGRPLRMKDLILLRRSIVQKDA